MEAEDAATWSRKLLRPIPGPDGLGFIDPDSAPKDLLEARSRDMEANSYLVAVDPHEECGIP